MATTQFVEAISKDPYVRELHRRAVRVLNDPSLDREQRRLHIRRLQGLLVEHQATQASEKVKAGTKGRRGLESQANRNQGIADPSQLMARRREFGVSAARTAAPDAVVSETEVAADRGNDLTGRSRPVLTLRRA